jgi:ABC-2 type transport system permease protein
VTAVAPGHVRLTDLLRAELSKLRTLPTTWTAVILAFLSSALLGLLAVTDVVRVAGPGGGNPIAGVGIVMLFPAYVLVAVPVFAAGTEYRGGQLRVSLAATPGRHRWFAAKLLVSTATTAAAGLVVALPAHLLQHGTLLDLACRVPAGLFLGLIGFGFAAIARTVVTPLAVLALLPVLISPLLGRVAPGLVRVLPHEAMLSLAGLPAGPSLSRPAGLAVLAGWAAAVVAAGWWVTARRDS